MESRTKQNANLHSGGHWDPPGSGHREDKCHSVAFGSMALSNHMSGNRSHKRENPDEGNSSWFPVADMAGTYGLG